MHLKINMNKSRKPVEILVGLIVSAIAYLLIRNYDADMPWYYYLPVYFILLFYALAFTLLVTLNYLKTQVDKNAGLIISDTHFYKNMSVFSSDHIAWSEIREVQVATAAKRSVLIIQLVDNDKYMTRKNFVERYVLKRYIKRWGTPVFIPENTVLYDLHQLAQLITSQKEKYQQNES